MIEDLKTLVRVIAYEIAPPHSCEESDDGYKEGYKDGFEDGLRWANRKLVDFIREHEWKESKVK